MTLISLGRNQLNASQGHSNGDTGTSRPRWSLHLVSRIWTGECHRPLPAAGLGLSLGSRLAGEVGREAGHAPARTEALWLGARQGRPPLKGSRPAEQAVGGRGCLCSNITVFCFSYEIFTDFLEVFFICCLPSGPLSRALSGWVFKISFTIFSSEQVSGHPQVILQECNLLPHFKLQIFSQWVK